MIRKTQIAALLAAGCAACAPVEPPRPALPLVSAEVEPGAAAGVSGEARFSVTATRDGVAVPATCSAEGTGFRAAFSGPATVAIPSFGAASAPVRVACVADGRRGGRTIVPAMQPVRGGGYGGIYPSIGVGIGSGGGGGVSIGGYWGGGGWGGGGQGGGYAPRYPDIDIPLQ